MDDQLGASVQPELSIDPYIWYTRRKLDFEPTHFTRCKTILHKKSLIWIIENFRGRYFLLPYDGILDTDNEFSISFTDHDKLNFVPSFEDPQEATFYELKWS
jgi:hypothetical protein